MLEQQTIIVIALVIGLVMICVSVAYLWLSNVSPVDREKIRKALLPHVQAAIIAAYKESESRIDAGQERLRGADKAAFARALYRRLPPRVAGIPIGIVYTFVTEEEFGQMVEAVYARLDRLVDQVQGQA